jgi:hypothetical protein
MADHFSPDPATRRKRREEGQRCLMKIDLSETLFEYYAYLQDLKDFPKYAYFFSHAPLYVYLNCFYGFFVFFSRLR